MQGKDGEKKKKTHVDLDESHDAVTLLKSGHEIHIPSSHHITTSSCTKALGAHREGSANKSHKPGNVRAQSAGICHHVQCKQTDEPSACAPHQEEQPERVELACGYVSPCVRQLIFTDDYILCFLLNGRGNKAILPHAQSHGAGRWERRHKAT